MLSGMKTWGKIAAMTASLLVLAGCSAGTPRPAADSPTPTPTQTADEQFVAAFRDQNADADRGTDAQWLAVGHSVCDALDAGASPNQVVDTMQGSSLDATEAASSITLAVEYLCPENG